MDGERPLAPDSPEPPPLELDRVPKSPGAPALSPRLAVYLSLGVLVLGLFDCGRLALCSLRAPSEADWSVAEQTVRRGFTPGDLVVAAPGWADPTMRLHLGDLVPIAVAARADSDRFGRVWEVSLRGHDAPETAASARCETLLSGRVRVRRCEKPAVKVVYDFTDRLLDARVAVVKAGRETPCPFVTDHFACPRLSVQLIVGEIDYAPHRCIVVTPALTEATVRIEWPSVSLGHALVGYTGIHSFYARKAAQGAVDLDVTVGEATTHLSHKNDDGWSRFAIATPAQTGRSGRVRFDLSSTHPQDRKICFAAEARQ